MACSACKVNADNFEKAISHPVCARTPASERFNGGVIAIIIMVLELKLPHSSDFNVVLPRWAAFIGYVFSFVYVGILLAQRE